MVNGNFTIIKSPAAVADWLNAIVVAGGGPSVPVGDSERADCEEIVRHFANWGVPITVEQASTFWTEYSATLQAGWLVLSNDCVAALDALAEEIEAGRCESTQLQALRGKVSTF